MDGPGGSKSAGQARHIRTIRASEFAGREVPDRWWHVRGLIPGRTVTLLGGDGGTGKSLLAMQLAVATAAPAPRNWCGLAAASGSALYVSAEDDELELHRRIATICSAADVDVADLGRLAIVPLAGEDAVIAAPDKSTLKPTPLFAALEARIADEQPALVVLDTLADMFGGQENERAQARQFVGLLRGWAIRFDTAVLVLQHPSLSGLNSGTGTSGSTGWSNSVRSRLYLDRVKGDDGFESDPDARVLRVAKANYGRTGAEIRLRWQAGTFATVDNEAVASAFGAIAAQSRADQTFLQLLTAYTVEGRRVSAHPSTSYAPTVFSRDPRAEGLSKRGLADAMTRLFAARRIRVEQAGPPSRRTSYIAECDHRTGS